MSAAIERGNELSDRAREWTECASKASGEKQAGRNNRTSEWCESKDSEWFVIGPFSDSGLWMVSKWSLNGL